MALPNGNAARIRKALAEFQQDSITPTAQMVAAKLNLPIRNVSNALSQMHDVYRHRPNHANVTVYSLTQFQVQSRKRKSSTLTPPHYHNWQTPELTQSRYDMREGGRLAMAGPR